MLQSYALGMHARSRSHTHVRVCGYVSDLAQSRRRPTPRVTEEQGSSRCITHSPNEGGKEKRRETVEEEKEEEEKNEEEGEKNARRGGRPRDDDIRVSRAVRGSQCP